MKNDPSKCDKRQKEVKKERDGTSTERHRCMDKRSVDNHLKIVEPEVCEGCPLLAALIDKQKRPCERHWSDELISVETIARDDADPTRNFQDPELGYEQPCVYRWDRTCKITGHPVTPEICKACDQETVDHMATLPQMAVGFANEVRRWIRHGRPVRTDEEVKMILETFCKKCELYDHEKEACKKCGCNMNDSSWPLRNGIKMKTKVCPMKLWR